jgi:hypothetical protein
MAAGAAAVTVGLPPGGAWRQEGVAVPATDHPAPTREQWEVFRDRLWAVSLHMAADFAPLMVDEDLDDLGMEWVQLGVWAAVQQMADVLAEMAVRDEACLCETCFPALHRRTVAGGAGR